jgi:hypothetical protein
MNKKFNILAFALIFLASAFYIFSVDAIPNDAKNKIDFDYSTSSSIIIDVSNESVNSSDFWDLLNTPNDITSMLYFYSKTDLDNGTWIKTSNINTSIDARVSPTYKKYSDINYVSVSNAKLEMPKAGYNYFYLDENVSWYDLRLANGTLSNKTMIEASTFGWANTIQCNVWTTDLGGYWNEVTICPLEYECESEILFKQDNIHKDCKIYTNVPNLTLIFPSTVSASVDLSAYYNKTQIESNFTNYFTKTLYFSNLTSTINTQVHSNATIPKQNTSVQFQNITANLLLLNQTNGVCPLNINGSICRNSTGTYIIG